MYPAGQFDSIKHRKHMAIAERTKSVIDDTLFLGGPDAIEGATVAELLLELERRHPAAQGWILDERGVLRRHINVWVNGELGGQDTPVGADDIIGVRRAAVPM